MSTKKFFLLLIIFFQFTVRAQVSSIIEESLPDRIGTGSHSSVIKSTSSLLAIALKSGVSADVLRYKDVTSVEYYNGSSWVDFPTEEWKNILDGNESNRWNVPYEQFRFTIDLGKSWVRPSAFLIGQDWAQGELSYDFSVESSGDQLSWNNRLSPSSSGSSLALNIFMIDSQTSADRYIRLTFSSGAHSGNPLGLSVISAFTKRAAGLTNESSMPFSVTYDQNIGLGTTTPTEKLEVNGTIRSKEIKVEAINWPDYVFTDDYELLSLEKTAKYIEENQHLPDIPSASEMETNGISLGEMNKLLLKKIEELTLHMIKMEQEIKTLKQ